jgi:hypothetical protein
MSAQNYQNPWGWDYDTDDEMVIHTPTSSADTSSDEAMATPTSSTATVTAAGTPASDESSPVPLSQGQNNDQTSNYTTSLLATLNQFEVSPEMVAGEEDASNPIPILGSDMTNEEASIFNMEALQEAIDASQYDYESEAERQALRTALRASRGPLWDYLPATREQHRIMSAYVEDMTMERGYHTKEDDKFFFEELLDDTVEPDGDDIEGCDDNEDGNL